jgi:hypothetical protein
LAVSAQSQASNFPQRGSNGNVSTAKIIEAMLAKYGFCPISTTVSFSHATSLIGNPKDSISASEY